MSHMNNVFVYMLFGSINSISNLIQKLSSGAVTFWSAWKNLKTVSKVVIIAETLDIMTTISGHYIIPEIWEANPLPAFLGSWGQAVFVKFGATFLVVYILEKVPSWPRFVQIVPLIASLPVAWNTFVIMLEILFRQSQ